MNGSIVATTSMHIDTKLAHKIPAHTQYNIHARTHCITSMYIHTVQHSCTYTLYKFHVHTQ